MNEFYERVCNVVCRHSGLAIEQVLHCRAEYETDTRYLLVHLLSEKLTNGEIVRLTGLSKQLVSKIQAQYNNRQRFKFSLRMEESDIRKELE